MKSACPLRCGVITTTKCSWCGKTYESGIEINQFQTLPKHLKKDMMFSIRKTRNARKYVVTGLVLKISKENGFKYIPEENAGKILVPCDHPAGEMILAPDQVVYLRR